MKTLQTNKSPLKKFITHPIVTILLSTIIIIFTTAIIKEVISKPLLNAIFTSQIIIKTITALLGSLVMISTYYVLIKYLEKETFSEFAVKKAPREFLLGLTLGICAIGTVIILLFLMDYYNFIKLLSFTQFVPTIAFILGAAVLEEIIFRGLFFRLIKKWKGPILALIISSIVFQIPHFMNSHTGILPAILGVLFGIVAALMYAYTNRLWLPIAFHFGWNIMQPAFGTTLSGVTEFSALSQADLSGPEIFIGNQFGIEVSLFSFLSLITLGIYYYLKLKKINYFTRK